MAGGERFTCSVDAAGTVRCWGYNGYGNLGYGHTDYIGDNEVPAFAGDVFAGGVGGLTILLTANGLGATLAGLWLAGLLFGPAAATIIDQDGDTVLADIADAGRPLNLASCPVTCHPGRRSDQ